ncbi:hypothetical protein ZOSMA_158G00150 [Zostera marina]|uniref:PHD-type domain-containing protein n=1 Tax=Zostera marina TaxID=29655 RepID=A0A0K9PXE0_ZOSMR|nr:hypothetical protein ZOSMA_223G00090 [Zostera marina]KMZ72905.1 hypothetical protein ZOSMA_158G00150 [Zostera marina]
MITVCQTCGALENPQLLIFCSICNTNAEHRYCLTEYEECLGDFIWSCEECTQPIIPTTSLCQEEEGTTILTNNPDQPSVSSVVWDFLGITICFI